MYNPDSSICHCCTVHRLLCGKFWRCVRYALVNVRSKLWTRPPGPPLRDAMHLGTVRLRQDARCCTCKNRRATSSKPWPRLANLCWHVSRLSLPQLSGMRVRLRVVSEPPTDTKYRGPGMDGPSAMAMSNSAKRKRSRNDLDEQDRPEGGPSHRAKRAREGRTQRADSVSHGVLAQYYPGIQTLRDYVLSKLPSSSRLRRKKIAAVGRTADLSEGPPAESRLALGRLLDTTIVVDFVVWLLFSREPTGSWPKHLLCDGFRKTTKTLAAAQPPGLCIPGLFVVHPNRRVEALKQSPWPELLRLLGRSGEQVIMDLLLDCTIFTAVKVGKGNLYQLSGQPISELQVLTPTPGNASRPAGGLAQKPNELSPAEIIFVKSRMMYSRPALNARGSVHFGLRHIHVLNRFHLHRPTGGGGRPEDVNDQTRHAAPHTGDDSTIHVMMYIFPRQFGLHNVFTSVVDRQLTAQKFQDYTLREEGIARRFVDSCQGSGSFKVHLPKRLRGLARDLTRKLQVLHQRCSYTEMLQHYCPAQEQIEAARRQRQAAGKSLQSRHAKGRKKARLSLGAVPSLQYASLVELATPIANISAFCQAVLARIIPDDFWGDG
ncbi:hypothetical protein GQ53DRAFT_697644, partial [Thozetella sp. PMI_491]